MRIAIIGSGISGLVCAHLLHSGHEITVFEANGYVGGHTHTVTVKLDGQSHEIDTDSSCSMNVPIPTSAGFSTASAPVRSRRR